MIFPIPWASAFCGLGMGPAQSSTCPEAREGISGIFRHIDSSFRERIFQNDTGAADSGMVAGHNGLLRRFCIFHQFIEGIVGGVCLGNDGNAAALDRT